jgi:Tfp pilus assembly protein PilF
MVLSIRNRSARVIAILLASALASANLRAQSAPVMDTLAEARRLRDTRDFAAAAALLRPYADAHPDDAGSARFAALMAYWAKDRHAADSIYAHALTGHPNDAGLRLEYARFLLETSSRARTLAVIAPMLAADSASYAPAELARARTLLGTADYWGGDLTGARREFATALSLDTSVTDARRQLTEIETAAAAWIRIGSAFWSDDQPLRHASFDAEAGWYGNPLTPLVFRAASTVFDGDASTESASSAEADLTTYVPAAHLDLGLGAGVLQRSFADASDWTARAALGVRLPHLITLGTRFARAPYTHTVRSLEQAVMVSSLEAGVRWGAPRGWLGEVLARREDYPDDNAVSTAYGWVLAPLVRRAGATVQAGYSFTAQSAGESRFSPRGDVSFPPGQPPASVPGEYNPYYTPRNLRAHSALVSASVHPGGRWSASGDGRYALSARDEAPVLLPVVTPPNVTVARAFYDRSFTPWNARGSIDVAATESIRIGILAEHGRGAYYSFTSARVALTYAFVAAARRRADLR